MTSFKQEVVSSLKDKPPSESPKWDPKFVAKTGALTQGLLSAGAKVLTHDCCSFAGHQILCANNETDWPIRHKAGMRKLSKMRRQKLSKL